MSLIALICYVDGHYGPLPVHRVSHEVQPKHDPQNLQVLTFASVHMPEKVHKAPTILFTLPQMPAAMRDQQSKEKFHHFKFPAKQEGRRKRKVVPKIPSRPEGQLKQSKISSFQPAKTRAQPKLHRYAYRPSTRMSRKRRAFVKEGAAVFMFVECGSCVQVRRQQWAVVRL